MKKYSLLLFDWDGCLARTLPLVFESYRHTFNAYGKPVTDNFIVNEALGTWDAPAKKGIKDIEGFNKMYLDYAHNNYNKVEMYPNTKETLKYFKNLGKTMMLVTTSGNATIEPALQQFNLEGIFTELITADSVTKYKPDPEGVMLGMEIAGVSKDKTIIIGDSKSDLGAAQNSGIDSVLFYPKDHKDIHSLEDLKKYNPTYIISDFTELRNIIS